jgi:cell division protein FtsL
MMPAEKWYEHQMNYQRYGLDMRPAAAVKLKKAPRSRHGIIGPKDKARLLLLTIFTGLVCIFLIVMAAYSAKVKYNINGLLAEADRIRGEIENINVTIKTSSGISVIEDKAEKMGMVYPDMNQIIYIETDCNDMKDFALALKRVAYNQ